MGTNGNANGTICTPNGTVGTIVKPMVPFATNGTIGKSTNGTIWRTPNIAHFRLVWAKAFLSVGQPTGGQLVFLFYFRFPVALIPRFFGCRNMFYLSSPRLYFTHYGTFRDLLVLP